MRICEICKNTSKEKVHQQVFFLPGIKKELGYTVVSCEQCGFIYADDIPEQAVLNEFYQSAGHHLHSVNLPDGLKVIHADMFGFIKRNVQPLMNARVLDVGSSMGHFLNHFQTDGIHDVTGLEPSDSASDLAKKYYDINVISNNLQDYETDKKYNLVTFCGVLEHIEALNVALDKATDLLVSDGHVFIAVPDAESFGAIDLTEPFLEFAMEHINFFCKTSLENLFLLHGFEMVSCESLKNDFYNNNYLFALFKKTGFKVETLKMGNEGLVSLKLYINHSEALLESLNEKIQQLVLTQAPLIVWGAGSLTTRLCATTLLAETNLIGFVDRNLQLQGKTLLNRTIYSPNWLEGKEAMTVLIASSTYEKDIHKELMDRYSWQGQIVYL